MNWFREWLKSAEERRQEQINAYVDGQLSAKERVDFETRLKAEASLQAEVYALQRLKVGIRQLPRYAAPRNYILDPEAFATKTAPTHTDSTPFSWMPLFGLSAIMVMLLAGLLLTQFGGFGNSSPSGMAALPRSSEVAQNSIPEATTIEDSAMKSAPAMPPDESMMMEPVSEENESTDSFSAADSELMATDSITPQEEAAYAPPAGTIEPLETARIAAAPAESQQADELTNTVSADLAMDAIPTESVETKNETVESTQRSPLTIVAGMTLLLLILLGVLLMWVRRR